MPYIAADTAWLPYFWHEDCQGRVVEWGYCWSVSGGALATSSAPTGAASGSAAEKLGRDNSAAVTGTAVVERPAREHSVAATGAAATRKRFVLPVVAVSERLTKKHSVAATVVERLTKLFALSVVAIGIAVAERLTREHIAPSVAVIGTVVAETALMDDADSSIVLHDDQFAV